MPSVTVTATAALILPARYRNGLILQNLDEDNTIYVSVAGNASVSATAGANKGLALAPGATLMLGPPSGEGNNKAIYAVCGTALTAELAYEEVTP